MKTKRRVSGRIATKTVLLFGGLTALLLVAAFWRLRGSNSGGRLAEGDALTVWLSGDTQGYLEPCGCRRDQAGGLPARMTLVGMDTEPHRLLLDVGNITSGGRGYELLKLDYILRGMATMGYDAVNLGAKEAELERDTLRQKIVQSHLPFVSCNVLDRETNKPLAAPTLVRNIGGVRIGITGVALLPRENVGPGLTVRPPEEALAEVLPGLRAQSDFVIVLAFAPPETLRSIATRFPEVGAVLGGDVPQSSSTAETVNRATLFSVTNKGKVIGRLRFQRTKGETPLTFVRAEAIKTADTIAPAPAMTALVREFKEVLRAKNIELAAAEGMEPVHAETSTADTYAGEAKCASCHATTHRITLASPHSHAYKTLADKGSEYDPECLRCHTVGYGAQDGFINTQKTPELANVQCESCHGRGTFHIRAVQAGKAGKAATEMLRVVTPTGCVRCHDEENSANFRYATFWPRIRHGAENRPPKKTASAALQQFLAPTERP